MFKSTKDYNLAMKKLLEKFQSKVDYKELFTEYNVDDLHEALAECIDRSYLEGITYIRTLDGKPHFDVINTRVTSFGLSFIELN